MIHSGGADDTVYTKVGRVVRLRLGFRVEFASNVSSISITGLPFTKSGQVPIFSPAAINGQIITAQQTPTGINFPFDTFSTDDAIIQLQITYQTND